MMVALVLALAAPTTAASSRLAEPRAFGSSKSTTSTLIMLHGLGDTGNGWADFAQLVRKQLPHVKVLLPTAPKRAITLNGGQEMNGWFDIHTLTAIDDAEDESSIQETFHYVDELIRKETSAGKQTVIGGFSQGGAISLYSFLSTEHPLAGAIGK
jgi:predicted esterase